MLPREDASRDDPSFGQTALVQERFLDRCSSFCLLAAQMRSQFEPFFWSEIDFTENGSNQPNTDILAFMNWDRDNFATFSMPIRL
jgi:hypothetical protein